jgi:acyl CoA:acetate/3-ketoacid CoA transferase beta subunit
LISSAEKSSELSNCGPEETAVDISFFFGGMSFFLLWDRQISFSILGLDGWFWGGIFVN